MTAGGDSSTKRLLILGSTGSIGTQALDVVERLNADRARAGAAPAFTVVGLAAGRNERALLEQARRFGVRELALAEGAGVEAPSGSRLLTGADAALELVERVEADLVLASMVGVAGLPATLAALSRGVDVALANKETLVAAGALAVETARRSGAALRPVDSEHSALWQCLPGDDGPPCAPSPQARRLVLTASGGPFRTWPAERIARATPAEALRHPTWSMGPKVTIDCASLTNKGLELIEAHWLFGFGADQLDVLIHPQSIVHSFVEYADGSVLAQLGAPDMRTPIQIALTWPERVEGPSTRLDFRSLGRLEFEPLDAAQFPAVGTALEVIRRGGLSGAIFNAANERAVELFLEGAIDFGRLPELGRGAVEALASGPASGPRDLAEALDADTEARRWVDAQAGAGAATASRGPRRRVAP